MTSLWEAQMRYFITGASGWIGSATVKELLSAGHEVTGLARSAESATTISTLGADVVLGSLEDLELLHAAAKDSDGVVHLGYIHDFSQIAEAAETDRRAIETFSDALAGTGRPLLIASGVLGMTTDREATEADSPQSSAHPRVANAQLTLDLQTRGVRPIVVRFAPTVHGPGDHGFISTIVRVARERGVSGYINDGANVWPAVHRLDAAALLARALDRAPAGAVLHAVAEPGVATRAIAQAIGSGLGLPVDSIPSDQASQHFGWIGMFFGLGCPASSTLTQERYDWTPVHPTLIEDINSGAYFEHLESH
jgi:nucleoside-diphosphate-sugar epimerase